MEVAPSRRCQMGIPWQTQAGAVRSQLFHQYFDLEACARSRSRVILAKGDGAAAASLSNFTRITSSSAIRCPPRALGGENFKVLGSQPDKERVIVTSRIQINGTAPIRVDWQLNPTNHGYKVTDLIVNGLSMASTQHSDLVSSSSVTTGRCQPCWLPCAKGMRATVSSDDLAEESRLRLGHRSMPTTEMDQRYEIWVNATAPFLRGRGVHNALLHYTSLQNRFEGYRLV